MNEKNMNMFYTNLISLIASLLTISHYIYNLVFLGENHSAKSIMMFLIVSIFFHWSIKINDLKTPTLTRSNKFDCFVIYVFFYYVPIIAVSSSIGMFIEALRDKDSYFLSSVPVIFDSFKTAFLMISAYVFFKYWSGIKNSEISKNSTHMRLGIFAPCFVVFTLMVISNLIRSVFNSYFIGLALIFATICLIGRVIHLGIEMPELLLLIKEKFNNFKKNVSDYNDDIGN